MEIISKGIKYNFIEADKLTADDLPPRKTYKQSKYLDIGCAFDIETSKLPEEKLSTMYMWQMAINDITIIGRTWSEFKSTLNILKEHFKPDAKHHLLVLVHNLPYEFSFIKGQLDWLVTKRGVQIFSVDSRKVIKAVTSDYIEFRDTLILTQYSLEKLAINFNLPVKKLVGDIDYDMAVSWATPLTPEHYAYGINDVQILQHFYHSYLKKSFIAKQYDIPLTATGIVRAELKRNWKKTPKKERNKLKKKLDRSRPTYEEYQAQMTWLYRGGFVHANSALAGTTWTGLDISSYDFKSSYPSVILQERYGWHYVEKPVSWFYEVGLNKSFINEYSYYGTFIFNNIHTKTQHTLESKSKIVEEEGGVYDNGRLIKADRIKVVLLCEDVLNYIDLYNFESVECLEFYVAYREELPKYVKDLVLKYFWLKETIDREANPVELMVAKRNLNSIYGMMCTGLYAESWQYNEQEKVFKAVENKKTYEELVDGLILLNMWGVQVSCFARRRLVKILNHEKTLKNGEKYQTGCGCDAVYMDTDSCYILNSAANLHIFESHNDRVRRINKNMYVGSYDRTIFKDLGIFDFEARYYKIRTLGAKRRITTTIKNGKFKTKVTVAGMHKGALEEMCERENVDIYEAFTVGLTLDPEDSKKLTTAYCDSAFTREFTDYNGVTVEVHEESCVTLYAIPFNMDIKKDYVELIEKVNKMNDLRLVKRRY